MIAPPVHGSRPRALRILFAIALGYAPLVQAFDIPTPANQPPAAAPTETPKEQPPLTPLPPTADLSSQAGAGILPEGVSVTTEITRPSSGLLLRAPFLVTLTILDTSRSLTDHSLHRPHGDAFVTRRISIDQKLVKRDGRLVNRYVYRFAVTPLQPGPAVLSFAEMTFRTVGGGPTPDTFMPVARNLNIRSLPGFWPEYLPVSPTVSIHAAPLPPLTAGQPVDWHLRVTGEGLTEQALLKMVGEQLISPPDLRLGAPEVRLATDTPVPNDDPLAETFSVRIPLLPDPAGETAAKARLPELRLPYIDSHAPDPGEALSYATLPAQWVHWTPPAQARILLVLQEWWWRILVLLIVLYGLGFWLRDRARQGSIRRRHRAAQSQLAQAPDPHALLQSLRQITGLSSVGQMIGRAPNPRFMAALTALDRLCYRSPAPDTAEFGDVRGELARWLPRVFFEPAAE